MRLIDADALLTERKKSKYYHLPNGDVAIPIIDIEHAPTVEVERTGKWVRLYRNGFGNLIGHCEKCGRKYPVDNFCPNCGEERLNEHEDYM